MEEAKQKQSAKRTLTARAVMGKIKENPTMSISHALREIGAAPSLAHNPQQLTTTPEWNDLLNEYLPRGELLETHRGLLRASRIESLTFPLDHTNEEEITLMMQSSNCTVRKIIAGANHYTVYFYAPDNRARKDALEMAYKLRGDFAGDKAAVAFSLVALANSQREAGTGGTLPSAANTPQLPEGI